MNLRSFHTNSPPCSSQPGCQSYTGWRPADFAASRCYSCFCMPLRCCRSRLESCLNARLWHFWTGWLVLPGRLPPPGSPPAAAAAPSLPGSSGMPQLTDILKVKREFCWCCQTLSGRATQQTLCRTCFPFFLWVFKRQRPAPRCLTAAAPMLTVA